MFDLWPVNLSRWAARWTVILSYRAAGCLIYKLSLCPTGQQGVWSINYRFVLQGSRVSDLWTVALSYRAAGCLIYKLSLCPTGQQGVWSINYRFVLQGSRVSDLWTVALSYRAAGCLIYEVCAQKKLFGRSTEEDVKRRILSGQLDCALPEYYPFRVEHFMEKVYTSKSL